MTVSWKSVCLEEWLGTCTCLCNIILEQFQCTVFSTVFSSVYSLVQCLKSHGSIWRHIAVRVSIDTHVAFVMFQSALLTLLRENNSGTATMQYCPNLSYRVLYDCAYLVGSKKHIFVFKTGKKLLSQWNMDKKSAYVA